MTDEQKLSHQEISRRGGIASAKKRDKATHQRISKKAAQTMKERYGEDYFRNIRLKAIARKKQQTQPVEEKSPLSKLFSSILGTKKGIDT